jgi:hypothetical protein
LQEQRPIDRIGCHVDETSDRAATSAFILWARGEMKYWVVSDLNRAEPRKFTASEHFPEKWTPVFRRKCDKR